MNHLIAPSSSGIEAARPQSTIVRERGRALIAFEQFCLTLGLIPARREVLVALYRIQS
jgi:hypothetical protein